jgi:HD-like signal output (HDOD) protein
MASIMRTVVGSSSTIKTSGEAASPNSDLRSDFFCGPASSSVSVAPSPSNLAQLLPAEKIGLSRRELSKIFGQQFSRVHTHARTDSADVFGGDSLSPSAEMMMDTHEYREASTVTTWAHLRLPPFPQIALRVLQLTNENDVGMRRLSELISSDPAFASEVLTIANSWLYAPRVPVTSILQAVAMIGTQSLKGICVTVGVRAYLGTALKMTPMKAVWRHNVACAVLAQRLVSRSFSETRMEAAYTAGILHDIGRLALAILQPAGYAELLQTHRGDAESMLQREHGTFGVNHCEAGGHLVSEWKLPGDFKTILSQHHAPRKEANSWEILDVVHLSCRLADTVGYPAFEECQVTPYPELLGEIPKAHLDVLPNSVASLAFDVSAKINAFESL